MRKVCPKTGSKQCFFILLFCFLHAVVKSREIKSPLISVVLNMRSPAFR